MTKPTLLARAAIVFLLAQLSLGTTLAGEKGTLDGLAYEILCTGLEHPWSLAFLPNGDMLVSERPGRLRYILADGKLEPRPIDGLPPIRALGQGGLLDLALHPDFQNNRLIYWSFSEAGTDGVGTAVARGKLEAGHISDAQVLFRLQPKTDSGYHFGSRLLFDRRGYLFVTLGDRGARPRAQDLGDHAGSLIRLHDDGGVPQDNPFVGQPGKRAEIYSYGHRNIQGAALHPKSGQLWLHEHGPQGGDEINLPEPGGNYGWPVITYGANYGSGSPIGEGTHRRGMEQPIYHWVPSIAPSGMAFYDGELFPDWRGDLLIGSLKFRLLVRLQLDGNRVVAEHRLLKERFGRIRDVRVDTRGAIYLLTDAPNGQLIRLTPAD